MDITNKTLAFFLVAAIVVSVVGTMTSLNKIDRFQTESGPAGLATTDTGNVSLYVNRTASIVFRNATINWGSGYVNISSSGVTNCVMDTKGGAGTVTTPDCEEFTPQTGLHIENDGNLDVNLTFNFSGNNTIIGDTADGLNMPASWQFNVSNGSAAGACSNYALKPSGNWVNITGTHVSYGVTVCDNFTWETNDRFRIDFRVLIPDNTESGTKNITLYAEAEAN